MDAKINMSEYYDTYFLDSKISLKNTLLKNRVIASNGIINSLLIRYYDANKIDNALMNCINVSFESMRDYFSMTNYSLGFKDVNSLKDKFYENIEKVKIFLKVKIQKFHSKIKNLKPDFQDKTLRIFAYGCRKTILIKYLLKNITSAVNKLEYKTPIYKQTNNMHFLIFFKSMDGFEKILKNEKVHERHLSKIVQKNSYEDFIKRLINIVNKEV